MPGEWLLDDIVCALAEEQPAPVLTDSWEADLEVRVLRISLRITRSECPFTNKNTIFLVYWYRFPL